MNNYGIVNLMIKQLNGILGDNYKMSIQYKLLQLLIEHNTKEKVVIKQTAENMIVELSDVWNI